MTNTRSPVFFIVFFTLLLSVMAIRFQPVLEASEQQCFYEHFSKDDNMQHLRLSIDTSCSLSQKSLSIIH